MGELHQQLTKGILFKLSAGRATAPQVFANSMLDIVHSCKILPGYRSDHSKIEFEILLNTFNRGKGT